MPTLPLKNLYAQAVILFAGMSFSDSKSSLTFVPWLSLSASDRHILSVTASRLQSRSFSLVSKSCEFLRNVLFKDFPAEIFLHRPHVLQVKYNINMIYLVKCNLTMLTTMSLVVKWSTSLGVKWFMSLAVKWFMSLAVKWFTSLAVKRSTSLVVKQPMSIAGIQFSSLVCSLT